MTETNDWLQRELNDSQREAVEYCDGPSLVIAGAGSGKTRVLTYKIAYLLQQGYEPWSILALTFTNKAADEMKGRIERLVGAERVRYLWMGTFHSMFLRILRYEHEAVGFSSNFTVYDAADSKSLLKAIMKEMQLDDKQYRPSTVQAHISNAKNRLVTAEDYKANAQNYQADLRSKMPAIGEVYQRYAQRLRQADAMDFDDLLLATYLLFRQHPDILRKYAERFRYILVDEYQDTNYAQHQIVHQLSSIYQMVQVVGDDAQSIYSFRGANIDNILSFDQVYPNSRLFKLEQNYRSTKTIVEAANSVIHKNRQQIYKQVYSEKEEGEKIHVIEAYSDIEESQIVTRRIQELRRRERTGFAEFAILYRTNAQSRVFEEAFRKQGYPYRIYGGLSFYQRKEIKDVISYFRLTVNPNDEEAFKRIVNYPARGIGNTTVQKIVDCANVNGVSLWSIVEHPVEYGLAVNKGTLNKLDGFCSMIRSFRNMSQSNSAEVVGRHIIQQSGIVSDIYSDITPEGKARQENLEELVNGLQEFCSSRQEEGNEHVLLNDYLSEVSLLTDLDSDMGDSTDRITLMTIHSAKGLEFNTVFVVGLEENLFPSQLASGSMREMEEERRLFYVAITRAQRHCFLTYAKSRLRYGKMEFGNPSRFISDIDPSYLDNCASERTEKSRTKSADIELPWKTTRTFQQREPLLRRVNPISVTSSPPSSTFPASAPPSEMLAVGQHIEHERFGYGEVIKVEGTGENTKATVTFQNVGTKQLLLKFARFKIV